MIRKIDLLKKIDQLERLIGEQERIIEFFLKYGKDGISIEAKSVFWGDCTAIVSYIYDGKLYSIQLDGYFKQLLTVIENKQTYITLKYESKTPAYIQIDKDRKQFYDITEIKRRYENQEKVSENLKQSAEALGDALSSIFSAPKQKTQKKAKPSEKTKAKCECEKKSYKKGGGK